jgi:hypothetical protein
MLGSKYDPERVTSKNFGDRGRGSHEKIEVMEDLHEVKLAAST